MQQSSRSDGSTDIHAGARSVRMTFRMPVGALSAIMGRFANSAPAHVAVPATSSTAAPSNASSTAPSVASHVHVRLLPCSRSRQQFCFDSFRARLKLTCVHLGADARGLGFFAPRGFQPRRPLPEPRRDHGPAGAPGLAPSAPAATGLRQPLAEQTTSEPLRVRAGEGSGEDANVMCGSSLPKASSRRRDKGRWVHPRKRPLQRPLHPRSRLSTARRRLASTVPRLPTAAPRSRTTRAATLCAQEGALATNLRSVCALHACRLFAPCRCHD